jgi:DnaA family protein
MSSAQIPLALRFPADQRFSDFCGSALTVDVLQQLASGESAQWTFLSGAAASGKTHLLLATAADASERQRRAVYLPLSSARGQVRDLLSSQEQADLIAIDQLDAIAGQREDEIALFDFHNRARATNVVLLYAARSSPSGLALELPDLRSRLSQCTQLGLQVLDESGRREVLQQRAARRGLSLDDSVLDYLFRRVGRDLGSLSSLLDRVDRASLAAKRRISVPFLRELLEQPSQP